MHLEGSRGHCYNHPLLQTSSVELPDKPILLIPKNPLVYTVTLSTTHPVAAWLQHNTRACTSKGHSSTYGGSLVCLLSHRLHTLSPLSPCQIHKHTCNGTVFSFLPVYYGGRAPFNQRPKPLLWPWISPISQRSGQGHDS